MSPHLIPTYGKARMVHGQKELVDLLWMMAFFSRKCNISFIDGLFCGEEEAQFNAIPTDTEISSFPSTSGRRVGSMMRKKKCLSSTKF